MRREANFFYLFRVCIPQALEQTKAGCVTLLAVIFFPVFSLPSDNMGDTAIISGHAKVTVTQFPFGYPTAFVG